MGCADTGGCQSGCVPPGAYEKMYEMDSDSGIIMILVALYMTKDFWLSLSWWVYLLAAGLGLHCLCSGERNEEALTGSGDRGSGDRGSCGRGSSGRVSSG